MNDMGKHSAPEQPKEIPAGELDYDTRIQRPVGKMKAIIVYCQPFYKRYRKAIVSALGTAISLGIAAYTDFQISQDEWYFIGTQVLATLGVYQLPNATNKKVVKNDQVQ